MRITPLFLALFLTLLWLPGHINASTEEACLEFTDIKHNHDLVITSSTWQSAGTINRNGNDVEVPEHCLVMAYINKRVSEYDKQEYAIGFEMRLPRGWNQRFLFQGNGGNDGVIVPAIGFKALHGKYTPSALQRGFAILSSDAGHTDDRSSLISGNLFAHDPQARLDYGYQANQKLVPIARQIMNQYYGTHPHHSYFMGCSNGGRHAMVAASRLASHFDGFVAGNPGFNLPKAGVTHAWDIQALLELDNDLSQSLTRDEMSLVAKQVVNVCDALDGLEDGMVNNLATCQEQFKLHTLQCSNDDSTTCLAEKKIDAINKMFQGPVNSKGEDLYASRPYDAGIHGNGWRSWIIEGPINGMPIIAVMGAGSLANVFTTPPINPGASPEELINFLRNYDFDNDAPAIYYKDDHFNESAIDFMTPPDAELMSDLVEQDGKLLVYHGASDPVFSVSDTMDWYTKLDTNHQGAINENVRLFSVPGMNHCRGGPATDQFDMLGTIVDWVENDSAPERIIARVNPDNPELPDDWSTTRSRPLCPYPSFAQYNGQGDIEDAANFSCVVE